jgi:hypothetical protein
MKTDNPPEDGCQPLHWVSFNLKEIDYIINLILDYGNASWNKDETLAGEAFEKLDAILKYRRKIEL